MNFCDVQRAQLAKSTLLTSTLVPLGSFQVFLRSVQMLKREWGAESNGKLPHLFIPGKTSSWFLSLRWKTCLRQNYSFHSCTCSEGPALGHNTLMMMMMMMMMMMKRALYTVSTIFNWDGAYRRPLIPLLMSFKNL